MVSISVVTVTYNIIEAERSESMMAAMECVQGQTCTALEHIILDGASTDGTQDLIEAKMAEIAKRDASVPIVFQSEPDDGLYDAMNKAVDLCSGDYVIFLNSDDLIAEPDSLKRMQAHLEKTGADYAFGETTYIEKDGRKRHVRRLTTKSLLQNIPFCHNSTLIRTEAFRALGGHDLQFKIMADYDMILRLALQGYRNSKAHVPIAIFDCGGFSSDSYKTSAETVRVWRKNYQPFIDMSKYSDETCINWVRVGQLPLHLSSAVLWGNLKNATLRNAALYSISRTIRRSLQPWRRWNNIEGG